MGSNIAHSRADGAVFPHGVRDTPAGRLPCGITLQDSLARTARERPPRAVPCLGAGAKT